MCITKLAFYLLKHITYHPNHHLNRLLTFWGRIVLHDCRWRPSRKLAAILKRPKLLIKSYSINCTFYMLKHTIYNQNNLFQSSTAISWQKRGFRHSPWRPSWTRAKYETPKYPRRPRDQYPTQIVNTLELSSWVTPPPPPPPPHHHHHHHHHHHQIDVKKIFNLVISLRLSFKQQIYVCIYIYVAAKK